jgi:hypothetical protein
MGRTGAFTSTNHPLLFFEVYLLRNLSPIAAGKRAPGEIAKKCAAASGKPRPGKEKTGTDMQEKFSTCISGQTSHQ